ncbi:hypothetical protein JCM5353_004817 [Sporobolomyces roseus]
MCQAQATLAYGLTVRAAPLYFAVKAWPQIQPVLSFFDLIFLRRSKGTLIASVGSGAVTRVPDEVWEEIRGWLVAEEIANSEDTVIGQLFCDDPRCTLRPPVSKRATWYTFVGGDCASCSAISLEWSSDEFCSWSKDMFKDIRQLLAGFGLDHPLERPITVEPDSWEYFNSIALIAAPSQLRDRDPRRDAQPAIVEAACRANYGPDEQTVIDVSFALPRNIDQRFIRFIRLFKLEVVESSVNKLSSNLVFIEGEEEEEEGKGKGSAKKEEKEPGKVSGVQDKVVKTIKPRWRLWMTCISDW